MITHTQYGFKPGSTTVDCLVDLIEEISTCLDQGDILFYYQSYCPMAFENLISTGSNRILIKESREFL